MNLEDPNNLPASSLRMECQVVDDLLHETTFSLIHNSFTNSLIYCSYMRQRCNKPLHFIDIEFIWDM